MQSNDINNYTNKVFQMDNLELLKELPNNSIDLIYSDILYGTGQDFGDYQDIKTDRCEIEKFYLPRLVEMRRVLKNSGTIYLQMDYRINHWVRCMLDDVFGYDNFINEIIWHYSKMNATNSKFIQNHDNILMYGKTKEYIFNMQFNDKESALKTRLKKFIKNDKIIWRDVKNHKSQLMDNYIKSAKRRYNKEELEDGDVVLDLTNKNKQKADTVWNIPIIKGNSNEHVDYNTQKPIKLIDRIVQASSNKGDIVADFFMGSGTTCVVAKELGRNYIGCDIGEKAVEITKERLGEAKDGLVSNE